MALPSDFARRLITALALIIIFACMYVYFWVGIAIWTLVSLEILLVEWPPLKLWLLTPLYPALPLALLIILTWQQKQKLILLCCILSALFDTAGYFYGSLKGKHKLAPTISPKKTWEGVFAGFVALFALGPIVISQLCVATTLSLPGKIIFLSVYGVLALAGDLLVSVFKRRVHIKDSGFLLPGHGGLLDRLDSVMLPLLFVYGVQDILVL